MSRRPDTAASQPNDSTARTIASPRGRATRENGPTACRDAQDRGTGPVLFEPFVPVAVIGMPAGRAGPQDDKRLRRAVAACGCGQPVLESELAAVTFVADDRILAAELIAAFEIRSLEHPVVRPVHGVRCLAIQAERDTGDAARMG